VLVTSTGTVDARCTDGFDGSATKQILALSAPEELARLVAKRFGELERTRQPAYLAQPVCEIPFRF